MNKKVLRSNFEPGSTRESVRRAQWKALGYSDEDLLKPKIAIVNSSSELAICFSHLDAVAKIVKQGVREAGGLPLEIRTAAPSDFIISAGGSGYILATRDLIVNDMEIAVEGAQLDAMVCLTSCDKTPPAHLMAAGRFNIPTVIVVCGYQPSGEYRGKHVDIEDVFMGSVQSAFGKLDRDELREMSDNAIRGPGVCSGMATANSMHVVCEALGMSLPGSAPVAAMGPAMKDCALQSGRRIVEMVWEDLLPRTIMTAAAFRNAVASVLAVSGSINCIKHLQAAAVESGVDVDIFELFNELGQKIPVLSAVSPNGKDSIEAFEAAGGARAVMKQLESLLDLDAMTVTGKTVGENLAGFEVRNQEVIRPISRPFSNRPPIVILRGSLAPESAVVKLGLRDPDRKDRFSGEAIVFDDGFEAIEAIQNGEVRPGHVLVVRGMGPKGGPGMAGPASMVVFALYSAELQNEVAFVSDGQLSGLCNKGLTIAEVSPEAAVGGAIGLVENGDRVSIDVDRRSIELGVAADELERRRATLGEPRLKPSSGWLEIYRRTVQPMSTGVVITRDG